METSRLLLALSTAAFVGAVVQAVLALRAGRWRESRWHLVPMALGFIFQCAFLYLRGQEHGRCPLTNQFEIFIFIGWSIMLLYFLVGTAYRLSLAGRLHRAAAGDSPDAGPAVPARQRVGRTAQPDQSLAANFMRAVALIAYAAFALACITGVMFLLQDRLLKRHHINALFHQLPPIHDLAKAITRMVLLGVVLLSIALAASFQIKIPITNTKMLFAWGVWALYLAILLLMWRHSVSARQTAWLAVGGFAVVFVSIWIIAK